MINNDDKKLLLEKIKELCKKEISLSDLSETLELNKYETLSLLKELENDKDNIVKKVKDDFDPGISYKDGYKYYLPVHYYVPYETDYIKIIGDLLA